MFRTSILNRLSSAFISLSVIPLLLVGIALVWRTYNVQREQVLTLQKQVSLRLADQVEAYIRERESELQVTVNVRGVNDLSPAERESLLSELLFYQPAFEELALLDASGQEVTRVSRLAVINPADFASRAGSPEFLEPVRTRTTYYSPVQIQTATGQLNLILGIPIEDLRSGEVAFVLVANLRLRFIETVLVDVGDSESVYLLNDAGQVIAHPDSSVVLRGTRYILPSSSGIHEGLDGEQVVLAYTPIRVGDQELVAVAEEPVSQALSLAFNTIYLIAATILIALILAIAAGVFLVRRTVQPLRELAQLAGQIEAGDLNVQAQISRQDEIGTLANSFNNMTDRLRQTVTDLEKRVADRTFDLQAAVDISQQIANLQTQDELLVEVTQRIRTTFKLYGVHIYLIEGNQLMPTAGSGDYNSPNPNPAPPIRINAMPSLVAKSARDREPIIVPDVSKDKGFLFMESLPKTRSEMVVPITRGESTLGALDLQATEAARFSESDMRVMTILARQIGVAIENSRLFDEQVQTAEELRTLDKLKSQFLASMSHELRTPLNAIINFTQFVINGTFGEVNERQVENLNKVVISGKHLLSLINDILDISKIEAGMLQLLIQNVDVNEIVETVRVTAQGLERPPEVALRFAIPEHLPIIRADKRRLRQILINLISNAVKFTDTGFVEFGVTVDNQELIFKVQDSGVGIRPEDTQLIFEAFQQTQEGAHKASGTGLGLPISKHLAEAHGGKLWVKSEYAVGSTFYVSIPIRGVEK